MNATVFTPLTTEVTIVPSTTGAGNVPLPAGETEASVTIGVRQDGDTTHAPGNYQWKGTVPANELTLTPTQFFAAIGATLPAGNYWMAAEQTDTYNGQNFTSGWETPEVPFSVPLPPGVAPAAPTLSVS